MMQVKRKLRYMGERRLGPNVTLILEELASAEAKFPTWPADVVHGVAIVAEEAGEAMKAAMHVYYEKGSVKALRKELVQTAAMALSMLEYLGGQMTAPEWTDAAITALVADDSAMKKWSQALTHGGWLTADEDRALLAYADRLLSALRSVLAERALTESEAAMVNRLSLVAGRDGMMGTSPANLQRALGNIQLSFEELWALLAIIDRLAGRTP